MKLYHTTNIKNKDSILSSGLKANNIGIVYLSPKKEGWRKLKDNEILLEVETGDKKLTAFPDCKEWEVLCWSDIEPDNIKLILELEEE